MQDNLGNSEIHGDDDDADDDDDDDNNLIVAKNNAKSSTMPSVINPYHENERENENAKVAVKAKQNANATDKGINEIPLDCNSAVVSNLICDISNIQLTDQIVVNDVNVDDAAAAGDVDDDNDDYKNIAIIAPSPTQKSISKIKNANKRCKKCNCVCDKSTNVKFAQNAIKTKADDGTRNETDGCAGATDVVHVQPMTTTTT